MEDTLRHKGLRRRLIEEIEAKGISDKNVLNAMYKVPRHFFMESGLQKYSYKDQAFPIAAGQTIAQPYTVAFQTQLLNIKNGDKVLEIGTGSGYQTAILMELGAKVYTIERQYELFLKVKTFLSNLGYNPHLFFGDGFKGQANYGPFDKILITAAAPFIPEDLKNQMGIGGTMVLPLGKNSQVMQKIEKTGENQFRTSNHGYFSFVPMLGGTEGR